MKDILVDTNVILRLILSDVDSQFEEVKKVFLLAKKGKLKLTVPETVVFEVFFTLSKYYKLEKKDVIDKTRTIVMTEYISVESRKIFDKTMDIYAKRNLSFVDCFLLAKSKIEGKELFSFDKKLLLAIG